MIITLLIAFVIVFGIMYWVAGKFAKKVNLFSRFGDDAEYNRIKVIALVMLALSFTSVFLGLFGLFGFWDIVL